MNGVQHRPQVLFTEFHLSRGGAMLSEDLLPSISALARLSLHDGCSEEELVRLAIDADIVVNVESPITERVVATAPRLKAVVKYGIGVDNVDIDAATRRGVVIAIVPHQQSVAEGAILLLLAVAKKLNRITEAAKSGRRLTEEDYGVELYGKTLGIIGLGGIGSNVARVVGALGMSVLAYDPYASAESARSVNAQLTDLHTLLQAADAVSINSALTKETHHLIGEPELKMMKPNAFLINTARGAIVDEAALYAALRKGQIAGAGLDVFENEPLRPTNPLLQLDNVIATPHSVAATIEDSQRLAHGVATAVIRVLEGRLPDHIANPAALEHGSTLR